MIGGTPRELRLVLAGFDALLAEYRTTGRTPPADLLDVRSEVHSAVVRQHPPTVDGDEQPVDHAGVFAFLLDYDDLAAATRLGRRTLERLVATGDLPAVTVGGRTMFRPADVDAYVDALPTKETA